MLSSLASPAAAFRSGTPLLCTGSSWPCPCPRPCSPSTSEGVSFCGDPFESSRSPRGLHPLCALGTPIARAWDQAALHLPGPRRSSEAIRGCTGRGEPLTRGPLCPSRALQATPGASSSSCCQRVTPLGPQVGARDAPRWVLPRVGRGHSPVRRSSSGTGARTSRRHRPPPLAQRTPPPHLPQRLQGQNPQGGSWDEPSGPSLSLLVAVEDLCPSLPHRLGPLRAPSLRAPSAPPQPPPPPPPRPREMGHSLAGTEAGARPPAFRTRAQAP